MLSPSPSPDPATDWNRTTSPAVVGYTEEVEEEGEEEEEGEGAFSGSCGSSGSTAVGPQMFECEGGGYQVDPSTVSKSPIRFQRRILSCHEYS